MPYQLYQNIWEIVILSWPFGVMPFFTDTCLSKIFPDRRRTPLEIKIVDSSEKPSEPIRSHVVLPGVVC